MEAVADIIEILSTFGYVFILIAIPVSIYDGMDRHFKKVEEDEFKPVSHVRQDKAVKIKYQIKTNNADKYAQEAYKLRAKRASN